jgi:hypothetical protein
MVPVAACVRACVCMCVGVGVGVVVSVYTLDECAEDTALDDAKRSQHVSDPWWHSFCSPLASSTLSLQAAGCTCKEHTATLAHHSTLPHPPLYHPGLEFTLYSTLPPPPATLAHPPPHTGACHCDCPVAVYTKNGAPEAASTWETQPGGSMAGADGCGCCCGSGFGC